MRRFRVAGDVARERLTPRCLHMPSRRLSLNRALLSLVFTSVLALPALAAPVAAPDAQSQPAAPVQQGERAQDAVARIGEAATLFKRNDLDAADRALTALINDYPGFADAHYLHGIVAARRGDAAGAAARLRKSVELAPNMIPGWLALASIEHQRAGHKGMLAVLRDGLKANPDHPDLRVELAAVDHEDGRDAGAVETLRAIVAEHPEHVKSLVLLATVLADMPGSIDEARGLIDRARAAAPGSPAVRVGEGWVLLRQGKAADAIAALEQARAVLPQHGPLHFYLASAYASLGRKDEARSSVAASLKLGLHGRELTGAKNLQKRLGG
jgi:predicted Zn-dependent protease